MKTNTIISYDAKCRRYRDVKTGRFVTMELGAEIYGVQLANQLQRRRIADRQPSWMVHREIGSSRRPRLMTPGQEDWRRRGPVAWGWVAK